MTQPVMRESASVTRRCWLAILGAMAFAGVASMPCLGQSRVAVQVSDTQGKPVSGLRLTLQDSRSGSSLATDDAGKTELAVVGSDAVRPGTWVSIAIIDDLASRDYALITPWDGRVLLPSTPNTQIPLVVARRGAKDLLRSPAVLDSILAAYQARLRGDPGSGEGDRSRGRDEILEEVARSFRLTVDELRSAIEERVRKSQDPYERGLAALYQGNLAAARGFLFQLVDQKRSDASGSSRMGDLARFLARRYGETGYPALAVDPLRVVLEEGRADASTHVDLAEALTAVGDLRAAQGHFQTAETLQRGTTGPVNAAVARRLLAFGEWQRLVGAPQAALASLREAHRILTNTLSASDPLVGRAVAAAGLVEACSGDLESAEQTLVTSLTNGAARVGSDPEVRIRTLQNLATVQLLRGDVPKCGLALADVAASQFGLATRHPLLARTWLIDGLLHLERHQPAEARVSLTNALSIFREAQGSNACEVGKTLFALGRASEALGAGAEAQQQFAEALGVQERALGGAHPICLAIRQRLLSFHRSREGIPAPLRERQEAFLGLEAPSGALTVTHAAPGELVFEGVTSFPLAAVRQALSADAEVQQASAPSVSPRDYARVVCRRLLAGYRNEGFLDCLVISKPQPDGRFSIAVTEGRRYRKGGIRLTGVEEPLKGQLLQRLGGSWTNRVSAAETARLDRWLGVENWESRLIGARPAAFLAEKVEQPVWQQDDPYRYDTQGTSGLTNDLQAAFADLGYFFPKFEASLEPVNAQGTVWLDLKVRSPGPPGVIGNLQIEGSPRNSPLEVADLLGIKKGAVLTSAAKARFEDVLWQSARFIEVRVTPREPAPDARFIEVVVRVEDAPEAPSVGEEFSPAQQATLRFRDWLAGFPKSQEELVLEFERAGQRATLAIAPQQGLALILERTDRSELDWGFLLEDDRVAFVSGVDRAFWSGPGDGVQLLFTTSVESGPATLSDDSRHHFATALLVRSRPASDPVPIVWDLRLSPVTFLHILGLLGPRFSQETGIDSFESEKPTASFSLVLDSRTGRPMQMLLVPKPREWSFRVRSVPGQFAALAGRIRQQTQSATRDGEASPLLALQRFGVRLATELVRGQSATLDLEPWAAWWLEAGWRFMTESMKTDWGGVLGGAGDVVDPPFALPGRSNDAWDAFATLILGRLYYPALDFTLPRGAWPWTAARLLGSVLLRDPALEGEASRIYYSSDVGPLACLAMASACYFERRDLSRLFALRGLEVLAEDRFAADLKHLLASERDRSALLPQLAGAVRRALEQMPEGSRPLGVEDRALVAAVGRVAARYEQGQGNPEEAARLLWNAHARPALEAALRGLAEPGFPESVMLSL